ncbi:hypothetical protein GF339_06350 [candidate division KSB3 bacterium]|uniref:Glycosyltransferase RgtA/B/C/D-like domain-containing protein n=1 Tax=candidate division KSB3 bacterium TaxID=2044937 RepID=A0A9D5JUE4_9BACT|nr:hypothetical protein [candidate division KSB3 bacterium]MBD3324186.1 hypothetical protein [candidate division KSB3 bacterium]
MDVPRIIEHRRGQRLILLLLGLVILRGLIYGLVIPFDRAPDEKHHLKLIKAKQLQLANRLDQDEALVAARLEAAWLKLFRPESDPEDWSLEKFMGARLPDPPASYQLYYWLTAWMLRVFALDDMRAEVYGLRAFSLLCGTLVVLLSWLAVRELFPHDRFMLLGVPLLIIFIPQFSAMNGSINNDKLAEVFVTLVFWLMIRIFKHGATPLTVACYVVVVGCAILSKRTSFFLLPLSVVFGFVYFWTSALGVKMHLILGGLFFMGFVGGYGVISASETLRQFLGEHVIWISLTDVRHFLLHEAYSTAMLKLYAKFFIVVYWSFWGVFGYMTIHLHHFWYMLAAVFQLLAIGGLAKQIVQVKRGKVTVPRVLSKTLYLFAVSIIFAVTIMFLRSIVFRPESPVLTQGRYLFTVILPISFLTIWGLRHLVPPHYLRIVAAAGLAGLILLDSVCLSNYLLLNFHFRSLF